jgi:hypothetical protein
MGHDLSRARSLRRLRVGKISPHRDIAMGSTQKQATLTQITVGFADGSSCAFESKHSDFSDPGLALLAGQ